MKITRFAGEYYFLSNFSKSEIWLGDRMYPTVEHFYQANKAKTEPLHNFIRESETPVEAKQRGKKVDLREDWEEVKLRVMKLGLILKFDTNELGDKLLATKDYEIVEGNNWGDTYWGVCDGIGRNELGKLLMEVRDEVLKRRSRQITIYKNSPAV